MSTRYGGASSCSGPLLLLPSLAGCSVVVLVAYNRWKRVRWALLCIAVSLRCRMGRKCSGLSWRDPACETVTFVDATDRCIVDVALFV